MNQARITTYEKRSLGEKHAERALSKYHRRALRDTYGEALEALVAYHKEHHPTEVKR